MVQTFAIDFFLDSIPAFRSGYAVVVIDVIRATTTAITAVATGRQCFVADSLARAYQTARYLQNALLVGELDGAMPLGFHVNNSPSELARRSDISRPMVLLSSSGSRLMHAAGCCEAGYLACFRNYSSTADYLMHSGHRKVALIGAGTKNEIREEDAICCAFIAKRLMAFGAVPENDRTLGFLNRWGNAATTDCLESDSVGFLRRTGQLDDLHFVLNHIDDLNCGFAIQDHEIVSTSAADSKRLVAAA
jgi:2-phosphosulfolactate phosphatase